MADKSLSIGSLRWQVQIVRRVQSPDPSNQEIDETPTVVATVHADIQPIGAMTFWSAQQVETPVTHAISMRWQPYLTNDMAIIRTISLPDGTTRVETYRVRRIKEIEGRHRFSLIEAELENAFASAPSSLQGEGGFTIETEAGQPLQGDVVATGALQTEGGGVVASEAQVPILTDPHA